MKLIDVLEEIQERSQSTLTMKSLVRKINTVRNQIVRQFENRLDMMAMDILEDVPLYPLTIPVDSIQAVLVNDVKYKYEQFNDRNHGDYYYYIVDGAIGIVPKPKETIEQGLTIFFKKRLEDLTTDNLEADLGLDQDYEMLVVYGVLRDITNGNEHYEFKNRYEELLRDYLAATANSEPETHTIVLERW